MFALCEDAKGAPWMAVSILWDHASLKRHGFKKFVDRKFDGEMDRDFELVEDGVVRYMSVSRIRGYCYTVACSRSDFAKRKASGELPTHPREGMVRFCRNVYDSRLREIAGPRVLDSDAKLEDVGFSTEVRRSRSV